MGRSLRPMVVLFATMALALAGCSAVSNDATSASEAALDRIDITRGDHIVIPQHTTWTIERGAPSGAARAKEKVRVVGYGDSIFAGYKSAAYDVARRQAVYVAGEYLAREWDSDVEVVVRALSGAVSAEIVDQVRTETAYIADPKLPARAIFVEMCGNDYLQARNAWAFATGECDYAPLDAAVDGCIAHMAETMDLINRSALPSATRTIMNLYYPGFASDGQNRSFCRDSTLGRRPFVQDALLPRMARSNWRACDLARQKGFHCVDAFAELMAADHDTNGDGMIDADALRIGEGESEADYVAKITVGLRPTLRDARSKQLSAKWSLAYIQPDDVHPTYLPGILDLDPKTGQAVGHGPPDFRDDQIVDGKNPQWNATGHERIGWAMAKSPPPPPNAATPGR